MAEHLTHGWEPETPATDSLVRRFVEGWAERGEWLAQFVGGRAERRNGVALADLNSPVAFENTAVLLQPPVLVERADVLTAIDDFFPSGAGVVLLSPFPTWDLTDANFALVGHPSLMYRAVGGPEATTPPGVEIRPVQTRAEQQLCGRVLADAYPMPGVERSALVGDIPLDGPLRLFIAYVDGECVATGGTWNSLGLNDVNWISAQPSTRGKGVGAAITYASTVAFPNDPAVLVASDLGHGVYERLGYVDVMRTTMWVRGSL